MSATTIDLCERLATLADNSAISEDFADALAILGRCSDTRDFDLQLERMAEVYMQRGLSREFLEVTKAMIARRGDDARVRGMHRLACMLNNIQSST